jgi:N-acetylglucosamine kinase-like BadF-type ATPase
VSTPTFRIGVDGGGTKTDLILIDGSGSIVAQHTAPGCSPSLLGIDAARTVLTESLVALRGDRTVDHTCLFMAGSPTTWKEIAALLQGFGTVATANDSLPVLELATDGRPGLVLHAGTGSFVAARSPDGATHYAGGVGWKFGDPGSGHDLGRRGIAHALLELQGWAPPSALGTALQEHTALTESAAITRFFYTQPEANARIVAFGRRVVELAQTGCRPAQTALAASLAELVAQAHHVTAKLFPGAKSITCGVSGALLNAPVSVFTLRALAETHLWPVDYRFISEPPIEGVRRLLLRA